MTRTSAEGAAPTPDTARRAGISPLGVGVLVVMLLAFFWQALLLGRSFYVYDLSMAYLPVQLENARLRAQGQFPLWNRYLFCGYPINAESESGGLYPPALVFNLPLSPERAYTVYIAFHYVLAFGSMLLLGKYMGLGAVARAAAAMVLTFGGTFVAQTVNLPLVTTFAWVPLILALQLRALQRGTYGPAVLAGVCLGVQLLGAHPQMVFYGGLLMVLLALMRPGADGGQAGFWFSVRVLAVMMVVGVGLGAPQLFYNLELLKHSDRSGGVSYEFLTMLSFPPHYLAQLIVPDLLGRESHYIGTEVFEEQRFYLGLVTLGVVVAGWRMAGRMGRFWRLVLVGSLVLCFGHFVGLYRVLQYVPGFDMFRAPCRWLFVVTLAAACLAGAGVERLLSGEETIRRTARLGAVLYGGLAVVLLVIGTVAVRVHSPSAADAPQPWLLRAYATLADWGIQDRPNHVGTYDPDKFAGLLAGAWRDLGGGALRAGLLAGLTAAWWWATRRKQSVMLVSLTLLVLLGVDLWRGQGHLHRFAGGDYYRRDNQRIEMFKDDPDHFRIMPAVLQRPRDPVPDGLINNFGSLYELEVLDGFPSVDLTLMDKFAEGGLTPAQRNMVGAKYFQAPFPMPLPGLEEVYRDDQWYIYKNPTALPRVMLLRDYEVIPDQGQLFARLKSPSFDPARTVLLEAEPRYEFSSDRAPAERDALSAPQYHGQSVEIDVELAQPAILVLFDFCYPGWRAALMGGPEVVRIPVLRAGGIFRAVALREGKHRVVFDYHPGSFFVGLFVALATLLGVVVWCMAALVRPRRRRTGDVSWARPPPANPGTSQRP